MPRIQETSLGRTVHLVLLHVGVTWNDEIHEYILAKSSQREETQK